MRHCPRVLNLLAQRFLGRRRALPKLVTCCNKKSAWQYRAVMVAGTVYLQPDLVARFPKTAVDVAAG